MRLVRITLAAARRIRRRGIVTSLAKAARCCFWHRRRLVLLERELCAPLPPLPDPLRGRRWQISLTYGRDCLPLFERHCPHRLGYVSAVVESGGGVILANVDGAAVAYALVAFRDHYDDQYRYTFPVDDGDAFGWNLYILPAYRRTLVYADIVRAGMAHLQARGCKRLLICADMDRDALMKLHLRFFHETGRMIVVRRSLFWRWSRLETYEPPLLDGFIRKRSAGRSGPACADPGQAPSDAASPRTAPPPRAELLPSAPSGIEEQILEVDLEDAH